MTAAYYANTRLNDVMTYASINIPGLPRIPILSPQAAAQNAFMMKTNSMRPCLQPNLSVPPPGFIPLMPVPTGPTFHHGPGAYPMGPVFQPGVFHSPNFITMTPHPSGPTFMQQTKVNICANVNINSSVSATFNINTSNNRSDGGGGGLNPVLALNNNLRPGASATSASAAAAAAAAATTTSSSSGATATSSTAPSSMTDGGRKACGEVRLLGKVSALGGWSPLAAVKPPAASAAKTAAGVKAGSDGASSGGSSDGSFRSHGNPDSEAKTAGRHKAGSEDGRNKDEAGGRADPERWRGARGSNTDNLIHVFPPRQ